MIPVFLFFILDNILLNCIRFSFNDSSFSIFYVLFWTPCIIFQTAITIAANCTSAVFKHLLKTVVLFNNNAIVIDVVSVKHSVILTRVVWCGEVQTRETRPAGVVSEQ